LDVAFFIDYQLHNVISDYWLFTKLNSRYFRAIPGQGDPVNVIKGAACTDESDVGRKPELPDHTDARLTYKSDK
jgi:hypothetical protein